MARRSIDSILEEISHMTREERGALMQRINAMSLSDEDKVEWAKMIMLIDHIDDCFDQRKPT